MLRTTTKKKMNKKTYSLFFFFFSSSRATSARGPRDEKKEIERERKKLLPKDVCFKCEETSFFCLEKKKK